MNVKQLAVLAIATMLAGAVMAVSLTEFAYAASAASSASPNTASSASSSGGASGASANVFSSCAVGGAQNAGASAVGGVCRTPP